MHGHNSAHYSPTMRVESPSGDTWGAAPLAGDQGTIFSSDELLLELMFGKLEFYEICLRLAVIIVRNTINDERHWRDE